MTCKRGSSERLWIYPGFTGTFEVLICSPLRLIHRTDIGAAPPFIPTARRRTTIGRGTTWDDDAKTGKISARHIRRNGASPHAANIQLLCTCRGCAHGTDRPEGLAGAVQQDEVEACDTEETGSLGELVRGQLVAGIGVGDVALRVRRGVDARCRHRSQEQVGAWRRCNPLGFASSSFGGFGGLER